MDELIEYTVVYSAIGTFLIDYHYHQLLRGPRQGRPRPHPH